MSFIPASRSIHSKLQRNGNAMFLCGGPLVSKVLLRSRAAGLGYLMIFLLSASGATADSTEPKPHGSAAVPNDPTTVLRVKLVLEKDSPIMEITSTRSMRPVIKRIEDPPALTIDLNNAQISVRHKEIAVQSPLIKAVHLDQLALTPPVVRIVVSQRKLLSYTWDAAGNRLTIRLHVESEEAKAKPPSLPALAKNAEPFAVPVSAGGKLVFADRLASGTSFSAGFGTETLRLSRGGEVHVCPGTTVSIVHPQNGPDLMLAMGVGALETHYALEDSADTIVTPDFRILLRGPGEFHYAIRADARGNTCVRALPGNTAPVMVYESIGNGQFEVVPTEKLVFHAGHLSATDTAFHSGQLTQIETVVPDDCGCPEPRPILRAELPAMPVLAGKNISAVSLDSQSKADADSPQATLSQKFPSGPEIAALPPLTHNEESVKFAASLVFSRKDARAPNLVDLPLYGRQIPFLYPNVVPLVPPQVVTKKTQKGVLRKVSGFFRRIFR
jgi:AMIN domain